MCHLYAPQPQVNRASVSYLPVSMEVADGPIIQAETLLCIPRDGLSAFKRSRIQIAETTGESHSTSKTGKLANVTDPPALSRRCKLARECLSSVGDIEKDISLDSSFDSSKMPEPHEELNTLQEWDFKTIVSLSCERPSLLSSDVISTIDYDETGQLVATGGLARKIRICSYQALINYGQKHYAIPCSNWDQDHEVKNLFTTICIPAKLSSLKWRPGNSEVIGCGDYDGSVMEWDVEHGVTVSEKYDHSGKTVWSIDYSRDSQNLLASASSDSTVRFWSRNVEKDVGLIKSPNGNSMCCVQFSQWNPRYVAVACADASVYMYDIRNLSTAVLSLRGHQRSVSYVRWLGENRLVSSSPDGTMKLWDISCGADSKAQEDLPIRTFKSHANVRNFVGLSVTDAGLIASGSETNEVFVYSTSKDVPVFQREFPSVTRRVCNEHKEIVRRSFVGSVCWTQQGNQYSLISANSEGIVQVMEAIPKWSTLC